MLSTPLIATAFLVGCQGNPAGTGSSEPAAGNASDEEVTAAGHEKGQLGDLAEACGFKCKALADGTASISGVRGIDAFFSATLTLKNQAALLQAEVNATLGRMAAIVGAEVGANAEVTAANIAAKIEGGLDGKIAGGISVDYQPPQCSVSARASVEAAAKCDASVQPGSATVECKGECVADANVMASCSGSAELKCTGTAPSFECKGECKGQCKLEAGAMCEGTCKGECQLDGSAACDGECLGDTTDGGMCNGTCKVRAGGTCNGECKGSCELTAAAECNGECRGECTYTPPEGMCEGSAQASCEASGSASVTCEGECKGEVEPPAVSAECEATAKAEAEFNAECTPPSVGLSYDLSADFAASGSASAKAELQAQLEAFGKAYGELLAQGAKLEGILRATAGLPEAAGNAVADAASKLSASADIQVVFNVACALGELDTAADMINDARVDIQASAEAIAEVSTSLAGG